MWYHVAASNEYLVITGAGIPDVKVVKKAMVLPGQKCSKISISPFDFSMSLQAMTMEKLSFSLPAVFTIGPDDTQANLKKYAQLLTGDADGAPAQSKSGARGAPTSTGRNHVQDIVKGIIEGETRVIVSGMTMEEIFKERQVFKNQVIANVQGELDQFGLRIYNANVKELQDTPGSEYFFQLSRKAHEGASNQAKIDVAEARMRGMIGEAEKDGKTKQEISKINAETAVLETKRKSEKATADAQLATKQTELNMGIELAKIRARRNAELQDSELQRDVEKKRAETELERLRATDVTRSKISKEAAEQNADAAFYTEAKNADAEQYHQQKIAEAQFYKQTKEREAAQLSADTNYYVRTKEAETQFFARQKEAEALFYAKQKEAEGLKEMAKGYGELANVLGGPQGLMQFLMLRDNTFEKLANANATAIRGLQPKITVWNTGAQGEGSAADASAPIRNLFQSLPPLFSTINDQTGMAPPSWMAQMPGQGTPAMELEKREAKINGVKERR